MQTLPGAPAPKGPHGAWATERVIKTWIFGYLSFDAVTKWILIQASALDSSDQNLSLK